MGINKAETKIKFGPYDVTGAESIKFEPEIVEEECKRQIIMRSDAKLPQPFASWSNSL